MNLPMLSHDKANHLAYGAAAACVGGLHSLAAGAVLCAVVAIGKEVLDRVRKTGTPDIKDVAATLAGGALVLAPLASVSGFVL